MADLDVIETFQLFHKVMAAAAEKKRRRLNTAKVSFSLTHFAKEYHTKETPMAVVLSTVYEEPTWPEDGPDDDDVLEDLPMDSSPGSRYGLRRLIKVGFSLFWLLW